MLRNFFLLLESRMDMLLYRLNLVSDLRESRKLISFFGINVDSKVICRGSYNLSLGSFFYIENEILKFILLFNFFNFFSKKGFLVNLPPFLEANYNLLCFSFFRSPRKREGFLPFGGNRLMCKILAFLFK